MPDGFEKRYSLTFKGGHNHKFLLSFLSKKDIRASFWYPFLSCQVNLKKVSLAFKDEHNPLKLSEVPIFLSPISKYKYLTHGKFGSGLLNFCFLFQVKKAYQYIDIYYKNN